MLVADELIGLSKSQHCAEFLIFQLCPHFCVQILVACKLSPVAANAKWLISHHDQSFAELLNLRLTNKQYLILYHT